MQIFFLFDLSFPEFSYQLNWFLLSLLGLLLSAWALFHWIHGELGWSLRGTVAKWRVHLIYFPSFKDCIPSSICPLLSFFQHIQTVFLEKVYCSEFISIISGRVSLIQAILPLPVDECKLLKMKIHYIYTYIYTKWTDPWKCQSYCAFLGGGGRFY